MANGKVAKKQWPEWCGVLIKAVDRGNWIAIRKFAVPLKACTATASEIAGVSVLTAVLDVLSGKKINLGNINSCIF